MLKDLILYFAVFLGCFFEGETSLVTSAFASHRGHLNIYIVMILAFIATQSWDWLWFAIGRNHGRRFIAKRPKLLRKSKKIEMLLEKNTTLVLLGYRFLYGFRTAVPLVIGMSPIRKSKYLIYSLCNTIIWDIFFSSIGYYFGAILMANWKRIEEYEFEVMGLILVTGIITGFLLKNRSLRRLNKPLEN